MYPVLFLDIDGCLNSAETFRDPYALLIGTHAGHRVDPKMVARLDQVLDATGAKVVVSSSWRCGDEGQTVAQRLARAGFRHAGDVIGETSRLDGIRGMEIGAWLLDHPDVSTFAIG